MLGSMPILPLPAPPTDGNLGRLPPSQLQDRIEIQDIAEEASKASSAPISVATHTKTIGIIHPPPYIRTIVEKTATFVAKNGQQFEHMIMNNNANPPKLNFLKSSDPYHAYYQHRLSEFRSQTSTMQQPNQASDASGLESAAHAADDSNAEAKPDPSEQFRTVHKPLEPPAAEQYTVRLPKGITGEELDIIKLTAQFVARNGKSFLSELTSREGKNPHFHFMSPTHSMFMLFSWWVDAYSKVLMPLKGLTEKLQSSVDSMMTILERCLHRLEWEHSQEQARQKIEDEAEQERIQMAMIDWHDFFVVEMIHFADDEDDDLPAPVTLEEVTRRSKMSTLEEEEIFEPGNEVEMEMDEEEVLLVEEGMKVAILEENGGDKLSEVNITPMEEDQPMRIEKNWKRPEDRNPAERDPTKYVVSPITGELILINEMSEHMRISLIDPKYMEQKEKMFAKIRDSALAQDDEISKNITGLAQTRPDIFGTTKEEVSNAVKAEIGKKKKKDEQPKQVIWDGHTGIIRRPATSAMSQNANTEDINDAASNLPGPAAPPRPGMPSIRPLPLPANLVVNIPQLLNPGQYPTPTNTGVCAPPPPRPPLEVWAPPPPMQMNYARLPIMVNQPPLLPPSISMNPPSIPVPPPPGSNYNCLTAPRPQHGMYMVQPPMPLGISPPPPREEAPSSPPLPEEPEPKRRRLDDLLLIPEDEFLAQHQGPASINVSVPNAEGKLKGQVLEIRVESLSEAVSSLKEKISGEIQLPSNKQKLSGKAGFLKDNFSLAYYNVAGGGGTLSLSLRERGGRKR